MRDINCKLPAHGLMFHHFYNEFHPVGQGAISANDLADLIQFVGPDRILRAPEWIDRVDARRLQPGDICITFDDGLCCQYDVAVPVLRRFGISAFFFVNTGIEIGDAYRLEFYRYFRTVAFSTVDDFYNAFMVALEKSKHAERARPALADFTPANYLSDYPFYTEGDRIFRFIRDEILGPIDYHQLMDDMTASYKCICDDDMRKRLWLSRDQIVALSEEGHIIGMHSHSHPTVLKALSQKDQECEYKTNRDLLAEILGAPPICMSHPCNSYDCGTLGILNRLGIRLGFRANMVEGFASNLEYPREDHANLMKELAFEHCGLYK